MEGIMSHITENLIKEEILPYFGFRGHVHLYEGPSTDDYPAAPPTNIIQTDQPFSVIFHWRTVGLLNYVMCGKWKCQILFERMGEQEFGLPQQYSVSTEKFKSKPHSYECRIDVPAGLVPAGVYRIVGLLTLEGPTGVPAPSAAFADLGLVQFYQDGPGN